MYSGWHGRACSAVVSMPRSPVPLIGADGQCSALAYHPPMRIEWTVDQSLFEDPILKMDWIYRRPAHKETRIVSSQVKLTDRHLKAECSATSEHNEFRWKLSRVRQDKGGLIRLRGTDGEQSGVQLSIESAGGRSWAPPAAFPRACGLYFHRVTHTKVWSYNSNAHFFRFDVEERGGGHPKTTRVRLVHDGDTALDAPRHIAKMIIRTAGRGVILGADGWFTRNPEAAAVFIVSLFAWEQMTQLSAMGD